jgi:hypothetical protein
MSVTPLDARSHGELVPRNPFEHHRTSTTVYEGEAKLGKVKVPWTAHIPDEPIDEIRAVAARGWVSIEDHLSPFCREVSRRGKTIVNVGEPYMARLGKHISLNPSGNLEQRVEAMLAVEEDSRILNLGRDKSTYDLWGESMSGIVAVRAAIRVSDAQENHSVRSVSLFVPAGQSGCNAYRILTQRLPYTAFEAIPALLEQTNLRDPRVAGKHILHLATRLAAISREGIETGNTDNVPPIMKLEERGIPVINHVAEGDPIFRLKEVKKHVRNRIGLRVSQYTGHLILHTHPGGVADEALAAHYDAIQNLEPKLNKAA